MRVECEHGYFRFYPRFTSERFEFETIFRLPLTWVGSWYTFPLLSTAPEYSIQGGEYLGASATKTYEGKPWEIMRQNNLVYDIANAEVVPIQSISGNVELVTVGGAYLASRSLMQPGTLVSRQKVLSYEGRLEIDLLRLLLGDVELV